MKKNEPAQIRNIAIVGHGKSGKTSLAEALLFNGGATDRLCKVDNGESVLDFEPEEKDRKITIMSAFHHATWKKHTINLIDTPGDANFVADTFNSLQVVDAAVLVIDAASGVQVITEKVWHFLKERGIPTIVFVNRLDRENTDYYQVLEQVRNAFGVIPTPLTIPIGTADGFSGVVDVVKMKASEFAADESGKMSECDMPADVKARAEEIRQTFIENIAESSEELLEKYLEGVELSAEEIGGAIARAVRAGELTCVMCGSAVKNFGVQPLLDFIVQYFPSPLDRGEITVVDPKTDESKTISAGDGPLCAFVFKTLADPYAGKLTIFRVLSGTIESDGTIYNATKDVKEKYGQILKIEGKAQKPIDAAVPGDIVAVAKLRDTTTGDTFCDESQPLRFPAIDHPRPVTAYAVFAKSRGDEDKMASSFARMMEEDPTLVLQRNDETREFVLSGIGQVHLDVAVMRLKRKFGVDIEMRPPKIAYRETIKGKTKVQGRHKKQTGGRGQFADTWIEIEPQPRGAGFEFVDKIVGGAIPKNYIPAVEKGIANQMKDGIVAGYPIVDVRVTLYDGSYHEVDSSDMAFQIAGSKGFKTGFMDCSPVLLEPIMMVEVTVPEDMTGDVMGDLNGRRGRVLGMEQVVGGQMVKAQVPLADMLSYSVDLTSMTSGRGMFTMEFDHYEEVPQHLAEKIIAASKKDDE